MISIYCIEDINDNKYIGSTSQTLNRRFTAHKSHKDCSSTRLNLYNSIIYEIERCHENERTDRERYWINKIDCVNKMRYNWNCNLYHREYQRNWHRKRYMTLKLTTEFLKMLDEY